MLAALAHLGLLRSAHKLPVQLEGEEGLWQGGKVLEQQRRSRPRAGALC